MGATALGEVTSVGLREDEAGSHQKHMISGFSNILNLQEFGDGVVSLRDLFNSSCCTIICVLWNQYVRTVASTSAQLLWGGAPPTLLRGQGQGVMSVTSSQLMA